MPTEPPPTRWLLSLDRAEKGDDLVGVGADLEPGTILAAYRSGIFPMGLGQHGKEPMGWWSPDPRGVLLAGDLHVSRSLRRSLSGFEIRVDAAFEQVVRACADPARDGRWITEEIVAAYGRLHRLGWAHSVETWRDDVLVGGLYGVAIGGLFAGESMFHRVTDASKAAVVGLTERVFTGAGPNDRSEDAGLGEHAEHAGHGEHGGRLIDVQWRTDHLARLGVREVRRTEYLQRLERALRVPLPAVFG